jgi:hypothetical protein
MDVRHQLLPRLHLRTRKMNVRVVLDMRAQVGFTSSGFGTGLGGLTSGPKWRVRLRMSRRASVATCSCSSAGPPPVMWSSAYSSTPMVIGSALHACSSGRYVDCVPCASWVHDAQFRTNAALGHEASYVSAEPFRESS